MAWIPSDSRSYSSGLPTATRESRLTLHMAKKMRNKQAELAKKMTMAKKQNTGRQDPVDSSDDENARLTDKEMKEKNDRLRFDELLEKQTTSMNSLSSDGYLSKEQEDAEIDAYRKGVDRLFEGDRAPVDPFNELVSITSDNALGEMGTRQLLPWLKSKDSSDYLIVVCDPRVKSPQLREAVTMLKSELPKPMLARTIIVNVDTPAENRRWLKKSGMAKDLTVFSDEKRAWMTAYSALGEDRWTMTMFVLADERVQKAAREMEVIVAAKTVQNAVKATESRRL